MNLYEMGKDNGCSMGLCKHGANEHEVLHTGLVTVSVQELSAVILIVAMAVVLKVVGVFIKYCYIMSRFGIELVGSSHGLNQEELIDHCLSVVYLINTYVGDSYMTNSVLGIMGRPRNIKDNHSHNNILNLQSSLDLKTCLHVRHLINLLVKK